MKYIKNDHSTIKPDTILPYVPKIGGQAPDAQVTYLYFRVMIPRKKPFLRLLVSSSASPLGGGESGEGVGGLNMVIESVDIDLGWLGISRFRNGQLPPPPSIDLEDSSMGVGNCREDTSTCELEKPRE